jgi:hypothetical protein
MAPERGVVTSVGVGVSAYHQTNKWDNGPSHLRILDYPINNFNVVEERAKEDNNTMGACTLHYSFQHVLVIILPFFAPVITGILSSCD